MTNAIINTTFRELLGALDARATINIFETVDGDTFVNPVQELVKSGKVYEVLTDTALLDKYEFYKVCGFSVALGLVSVALTNDRRS